MGMLPITTSTSDELFSRINIARISCYNYDQQNESTLLVRLYTTCKLSWAKKYKNVYYVKPLYYNGNRSNFF